MNNFLGDLNSRVERKKKLVLEKAPALEAARQALLEQAVELEEAKEKPEKKEFLLLQPGKKKERDPVPSFVVPPETATRVETVEIEEEPKPFEFSILRLAGKKPKIEKVIEEPQEEIPIEESISDTGWDTGAFEGAIEKIIKVPFETIVEKEIEKIVEVPVETIVEKIVEVPVEKIIEKEIEVEKIVEREIEKIVEVPVKAEVMTDLNLFTRLLEGVFQDINSLAGVKQVVEKVQALVEEQGSLTIKDYEKIVGSIEEPVTESQEEVKTPSRYQEGATATNPETGETIIFLNGKWQPENDK